MHRRVAIARGRQKTTRKVARKMVVAHNARSPLLSMPNEILYLIFEYQIHSLEQSSYLTLSSFDLQLLLDALLLFSKVRLVCKRLLPLVERVLIDHRQRVIDRCIAIAADIVTKSRSDTYQNRCKCGNRHPPTTPGKPCPLPRQMQPWSYDAMCPIATPEGDPVGIIKQIHYNGRSRVKDDLYDLNTHHGAAEGAFFCCHPAE